MIFISIILSACLLADAFNYFFEEYRESELPATDFCEQKSMGASGGLFHAQPEGIAETKRIPVAGLLKGLLAVLQFTLLSPGYAVKIPNCPQSSGRSRYPSEDNGHSLSYL